MKLTALTLALTLAIAAAPAAMAGSFDKGPTPGNGWGKGGRPVVGAPGPVAGIGLPILAVAGGVFWVKSRKRRQDRTAA